MQEEGRPWEVNDKDHGAGGGGATEGSGTTR